ncbi:MAG: co-chaperone GroES [Lentisphaerae bacterium]|nr:MAG: co-chaperone GroES [Lentisphaerota bacterium]
MADAKIKPLGAYVLVEPLDESGEEVRGGIVIPDSAKEKPQEYRVLALGTGGKDDKGNDIVFYVKEGDIVLTSKYGGTEVKVGDKEYKLVKQSDILAIIEK